MKKHILIVCQHYWPEAFRVNDIGDFLVESGHKIDVLCGLPNYPKGKLLDGYSLFRKRKQVHNGATIYRAPEITRGNNSNIRVFLNYISFPLFSLFYVPYLIFKPYDKIFLYQLSPVMMSIAGIILGKIKRVETTMYILDLWPENLFSVIKIENTWLRKIATKVSHWHYRHVDKLVVLSEKTKKHLVENIGINSERIIILPQTSEKLYEQDIEDKEISKKFSSGFNILYAGNISPAQSFGTMLEAAKILKERGLRDIRWIIVGDGMSRKDVERHAESAGLDDLFIFEGHKPIDDIPKYTFCADLLVGCLVKSDLLEATIPAKVMSYIASGKPIVLAMDGEVQDLINNVIRCGFAGPTENADVLAGNIQRVYDMQKKDRLAMGQRARKHHFQYFERDVVLTRLLDFILE